MSAVLRPVPAILRAKSPLVGVERITDVPYIRSVIEREEMNLSDGDALQVPLADSIYYLKPSVQRYADGSVEDVAIGVVAFLPVNKVTWNPHIAILPEYRGNGTGALTAGLAWMFENTPCLKVVAYPPSFNTRMIRVFEKCGFRFEGKSPKSFLWHGVLYDRLLMGLEKE